MRKTLDRELLEPMIFTIRGHRVVLDSDLARIHGVTTKAFIQAFKRNHHRFPSDFSFQITAAELADLRSQFVTSKSQAVDSSRGKWSQFATSSQYQKLEPLLQPPADPPKRRIGFHGDDDR